MIFREADHTYWLDGVELPSVSEITSYLPDDKFDDVDENILEVAADRGTEVHYLTTLIDNGIDIDGEYPSNLQGYIGAYRLFLSEHDVSFFLTEQPIYSLAERYAGTPDRIGFVDGFVTVVDYKCVAQVNKPKVKIQTNAYKKAYEEMYGFAVERLLCLQLMPDGKYRLYEVAIDDTELNACLILWRATKKKHGRGRID